MRSRFLLSIVLLGSCPALCAQDSTPESKGRAEPPSPLQQPTRVRVSSVVAQKNILSRVQPEYPPEAREQHVQGEVVLKVLIGRDGNVLEATSVTGPPILVAAASDAVKQWTFKPYLLNDQAIEVETQIMVGFHLATSANDADAPGGIPAGDAGGVANPTPPSPSNDRTVGRVRISAGVSSRLLVKKVSPQYPEDARRARVQGVVVLRADISKAGDIESVEMVTGPPVLVDAAIDAVKKWKYKPYLLQGEPQEVETTIEIHFNLAGG